MTGAGCLHGVAPAQEARAGEAPGGGTAELITSRPRAPVGVPKRLPYFCAGCPHNGSTVVPEGSQAMGGIGCHTLALFMPSRFNLFSHMGCEGANWIGMHHFVDSTHVFANVGDGTYVHSAVLAIRACVAAGVTITYKILFNGAVAMTGGQVNDTGEYATPAHIARQLRAEGVVRVVIVSDTPDAYRSLSEPGVEVEGRQELEAVQRRLREVAGVTAIIYDQDCATEKRRKRKRGRAPRPTQHLVINEEVCEGCGDCGLKSNCVAIIPKETDLGRKRAVDAAVCNQDLSCNLGFCPSFVTISGRRRLPPANAAASASAALGHRWDDPALLADFSVPEPGLSIARANTARQLGPHAQSCHHAAGTEAAAQRDDFHDAKILVCGVGGTGVVTLGAVLARAATAQGLHVSVFDQVGLSQKNGS
ncbi:MAG: thiamine pyrophosphate-dependent enzyme, partial [Promethearchaeia archaeon]